MGIISISPKNFTQTVKCQPKKRYIINTVKDHRNNSTGKYKLGTIMRELRKNNCKVEAMDILKDLFSIIAKGEKL